MKITPRALLPVAVAAALALTGADRSPEPVTELTSCERGTLMFERAVARVDVPLPEPWTIATECGLGEVNADGHPVRIAQAQGDTQTIVVWPEAHGTVAQIEWTLYHEIGHAYERTAFGSDERWWWRHERGLLDHSWRAGDPDPSLSAAEQWDSRPVEDWAESFAFCVSGLTDEWVRLDPGRAPTTSQCGLVTYLTGVPTVPVAGASAEAPARP